MKLYRHLAWDGIRKNSRLYVPYLLTGVGAVSFFYILVALSRLPEGTLPGSGSVQVILNLGSFVLWMFSLLLLFYTHSFLIRRRNREFALYNVLGMGKRDIARILCWETLLSGGISLAGGLALGILLGKLAELGLLRMVGAATDMVYRVSAGGLLLTLGLYAGIFLLILISSLVRVGRSTAVQLMRSQAEGEKPPRANWALAVLGILLLAGAYYLAVTIREPLAALTWFFIAVLMVIAATYLLFISGSVALCRLLQKNPRFYYQKRHFVSVSSLVYRMKRNGAGLASICILGTMVLVMLSSTTCLYFGAEDSLHTRYPRDENITAYFPDRASQSGDLTPLRTAVADAVRRSGMSAANVWEYRSVSSVMTIRDGVLSPNEGFGDPVDVTLIPLADYNAAMGTDLTLPQGQVYVCRSRTGYQGTSLTLQNGPTWQVAGLLDNFSPSGSDSASVVTQLWLIVPDLSAADALEQVMNRANMGVSRTWYYGFDLDRQLPDGPGRRPDGKRHAGRGVPGGESRRFLRVLRKPLLPGHPAERGLLSGRGAHHLLQADLRGLRGPGPLRHHAEGGYDPPGHPFQHQQPAAAGVLPAAAADGTAPGLRFPLCAQAAASVQPLEHPPAGGHHRRQLPGLCGAVHPGVPDHLQRLLPHRQRGRGAVMRRFAYRAVLWCGGAVTVALAAAAALTVSLTDRLLHRLES